MNFEKAVNQVKDRLETVGERSQDAAKVSLKTLKAANEIVIAGVQDIVTVQTAAAKDLYTAGKQSFDKAVAAGLVAVVKRPVAYLPDGRDAIFGAFTETVETVTKTGEKLVKVVKTGYEGVTKTLAGKPIRTKARTQRKARKSAGHTTAHAAA